MISGVTRLASLRAYMLKNLALTTENNLGSVKELNFKCVGSSVKAVGCSFLNVAHLRLAKVIKLFVD